MSVQFGNPLLQASPYASDGGEVIGRDPRNIPSADWGRNPFLIGLKAIRAKCLDCAFESGEVRKCVQTDCPLWPLRMGSVPRGFKIARREALSARVGTPRVSMPDFVEVDEIPPHDAEIEAEGPQ